MDAKAVQTPRGVESTSASLAMLRGAFPRGAFPSTYISVACRATCKPAPSARDARDFAARTDDPCGVACQRDVDRVGRRSDLVLRTACPGIDLGHGVVCAARDPYLPRVGSHRTRLAGDRHGCPLGTARARIQADQLAIPREDDPDRVRC